MPAMALGVMATREEGVSRRRRAALLAAAGALLAVLGTARTAAAEAIFPADQLARVDPWLSDGALDRSSATAAWRDVSPSVMRIESDPHPSCSGLVSVSLATPATGVGRIVVTAIPLPLASSMGGLLLAALGAAAVARRMTREPTDL